MGMIVSMLDVLFVAYDLSIRNIPVPPLPGMKKERANQLDI